MTHTPLDRLIALSGIAAPVVYTAAVVAGGALRPEYSHITDVISELIVAGAPNKLLLDILFGGYNILLLVFGAQMLRHVRSSGESGGRRRSGMFGAWALVGVALSGFATLFFPMDPRSAETTMTGTIHLVLAGLSSLFSILAIFLLGGWFGHQSGLVRLRRYSYMAGAVVLLTGAMAALAAATQSRCMGLAERATIGAYILWVGVVAWMNIISRRE